MTSTPNHGTRLWLCPGCSEEFRIDSGEPDPVLCVFCDPPISAPVETPPSAEPAETPLTIGQARRAGWEILCWVVALLIVGSIGAFVVYQQVRHLRSAVHDAGQSQERLFRSIDGR